MQRPKKYALYLYLKRTKKVTQVENLTRGHIFQLNLKDTKKIQKFDARIVGSVRKKNREFKFLPKCMQCKKVNNLNIFATSSAFYACQHK